MALETAGPIALASPKQAPSLISYQGEGNDPSKVANRSPISMDGKKDGDDFPSNPFSDHHSLPPPPFLWEDEKEAQAGAPALGHSHHLASAHIAEAQREDAPPRSDIQIASENLARALEAAAGQQVEPRARNALLRKAKKIRKKAARFGVGSEDGRLGGDHKCANILKTAGGGCILLVTTPIYLTGAVVEGTGTMIKATGMILKGVGSGLKKLHTVTMDKLDLKV